MKTKNKQTPKPRDPFQQHAIRRLAGAHGKTKKAERRKDKVALKKGDFFMMAA